MPLALPGLGLATHWEGTRGKAKEREDLEQRAEMLHEAPPPVRPTPRVVLPTLASPGGHLLISIVKGSY